MPKKNKLLSGIKHGRKHRVFVPIVISFLSAGALAATGCALYYGLTRSDVCTVTLHLDGGVIEGGETQKVIKGSTVGQLPTPFKSDKVFQEWKNKEGTTIDSKTKIEKNMSLYAQYKDPDVNAKTVTFDLDGGNIPSLSEDKKILVLNKTLVGHLPSPTKSGFMFDKWTDASGIEISPTTEINSDLFVKASYKTAAYQHIKGGSSLLQFKSDEAGHDIKTWEFFNGDTKIDSPDWNLENAPTGLVISKNGVISWNKGISAGNYVVKVIATKGSETASAEINVLVTDPAYTLTGGSPLLEVKSESEGTDSQQWVMKKDGVAIAATYSLTSSPEPSSGSITINNQGYIEYKNVKAGSYKLTITATTTTNEVKTAEANLISSDYGYSLKGGKTLIEVKSEEDYTAEAKDAWKLYKEDYPVSEEEVTWTATSNKEQACFKIANGILTVEKAPAGNYEVLIKAVGKTSGKEANILVHVNSTDYIYEISGGSTLIEVKSEQDYTDTNGWKMTKKKDASSTEIIDVTDATWSLSSTKPDGVSLVGNKIKCTNVFAGSYSFEIIGTSLSTSKTAKATVNVNSTNYEYIVSGGLPVIEVKTGETKTDENAWKMSRVGDTSWSPKTAPVIKIANITPTVSGITLTSDNRIKCENVNAGSYTVTISAEWSGHSATAMMKVISTNSIYSISGGSSTINTKAEDTTSDTTAWVMKKGTETLSDVAWSISSVSPTPAHGSIEISNDAADKGTVKCNKVSAGTYTVTVKGHDNTSSEEKTANITVVSTNYDYSLKNGTPILYAKSIGEFSDTSAWELFRGTASTPITTGVTWSVTADKSYTTGTIEITDGKIKATNLQAGQYTLTVTAEYTPEGCAKQTATTTVTLISSDYTYSIFGGTNKVEVKSEETKTDSNEWNVKREDGTIETDITWKIVAGPQGATMDGNKIKCTNVSIGTHVVTVTATKETPYINLSQKVTIISTECGYTINTDPTITQIEIKSEEEKIDSNTWHMYRDGTEVTPESYTATGATGVSMDGTKLKFTKVPAGTYDIIITGTTTGDDGAKHKASKTIKLISTDYVYTLDGGTTALTTKSEGSGTDSNAWQLKKDGAAVTSGVEWTLTSFPAVSETNRYIKMDEANPGKVIWKNVPQGTYELTITGTITATGKSASTKVTLTSTDSAYTVNGGAGSTAISVKSTETKTDSDHTWKMSKDTTELTSNVAWTLKLPSNLTSTQVAIDSSTGIITYTNVPAGTYDFDVVGTYTPESGVSWTASKTVSLTSTSYVYDITGGPTDGRINTTNETDTTLTTAFAMTKDGTDLENVSWSISPTVTGVSIINDHSTNHGKIQYSKVPMGTYELSVTGSADGQSVTKKIVLVSSDVHIKHLEITGGDNYITASNSSVYTATITPSEAGMVTDLAWTSTWTGTGTAPTLTPSGSRNATLTVKTVTDGTEASEGVLTIKVTDSKSGLSTSKTINVVNPYNALDVQNSDKVWTYMDPTGGSNNAWYYLTTNSDSSISYTKLGTTTAAGTIDKTTFNNKIYVGENVSSLPDNFLEGCEAFNSDIEFGNNNKLLVIGNSFMSGCSAFNKELVLPNSVQIIGNDFLEDCEAFNNGGTATTFAMPTSLRQIGDEFLYNCRAFNQNITIGSTVTSVGNEFMQNCDAMVRTITINTDAMNFKATGAIPLTLATDNSSAAIYNQGLIIDGSVNLEEFKELFPALSSGNFRKYYS